MKKSGANTAYADLRSATRVTLSIPSDILEVYEEKAKEAGSDLESYVADRLIRCMDHTAAMPVYLDDTDRAEVSKALGVNVKSGAELARLVASALKLRIDHCIPVALSVTVLQRIRDRAKAALTPFPQFLSRLVVEELERYVGLR